MMMMMMIMMRWYDKPLWTG